MFANATVSFRQLVLEYPGPLMFVSILVSAIALLDYSIGFNIFSLVLGSRLLHTNNFTQCPDPHFKRRHHKRRVVQKQLVDCIINNLLPGGKVCSLNIHYV